MYNRIKLKRTEMNLSQEKLAKLINVNRLTITRIEAGACNPTIIVAFKIAKALNCGIEEIFLPTL